MIAVAGVGLASLSAGCAGDDGTTTPTFDEGTVTIRLTNRDTVERPYEVVVRQGDTLKDSFSGVLPADQAQPIKMIATFPISNAQHEFHISTEAGQRGRTWDPTECQHLVVDAYVQNGEPNFNTRCGSDSGEG